MDIAELIRQGSANIWLLIPSAILLGALHGLEPGHSKTMMASFIVAIRGTVFQAVLLGLSATLSHTIVVWVIVLGGLYLAWFGAKLIRRGQDRKRGALMIVAAAVLVGNVVILTI